MKCNYRPIKRRSSEKIQITNHCIEIIAQRLTTLLSITILRYVLLFPSDYYMECYGLPVYILRRKLYDTRYHFINLAML